VIADVVLVDTNVLLDLVTDDPNWSEWSLARLEEASLAGPVLINDIVYAETSIRYARMEDLDAMLAEAMIEIAPTPRSALFLAGKAFQQYRAAGVACQQRQALDGGMSSDEEVRQHAGSCTAGRYRTYFPKITLIAPPA
jgi:predicted nucleic acid-binding protein